MFTGYKTYVIAVVMVALAAMQYMGIPMPEEVWMVLGALGLGSLRAAVEEKK